MTRKTEIQRKLQVLKEHRKQLDEMIEELEALLIDRPPRETIHEFVESWNVGELRRVPSNIRPDALRYYAKQRFNFSLSAENNDLMRRVR